MPRLNRRPILVVAAWAPELERFRALLRTRSLQAPVVMAIIGVGLVEAAIGTTRAISRHHPRRVLLVGTAGLFPGHQSLLVLGEAFRVKNARFTSGSVVRGDAYWPPPLPTAVSTASRRTALVALSVACPAAITHSARMGRAIARDADAQAETLETFAVARAAARAKVPWEAFLGVTNHVGPKAHAQWVEHAKPAAAAACEACYARITGMSRR